MPFSTPEVRVVKPLHVQLAALGNEVRAAAIPGDWERTADWCFGKLPGLYEQFRETNESRFGAEITLRVQAVLKELANCKTDTVKTQKLAVLITGRLHRLHEEFGLPGLNLRLPPAPRPRVAKVS
jgi:hypothetical protein